MVVTDSAQHQPGSFRENRPAGRIAANEQHMVSQECGEQEEDEVQAEESTARDDEEVNIYK